MNTIKFHIIILFAGLIWNFTYSQNYINYTEKDGLVSNFVYRMTQDNEGFIWFITDKGMSKFDGKTFKNFTTKDGLPNNDIFYFKITPNGRVWFFTRSDKLGYIENDSVYSFRSSNNEMMNPTAGINQSNNDITILGDKTNYHFVDSIWQETNGAKNKYKFYNKNIISVRYDQNDQRLESLDGEVLYNFKPRKLYYRNEQVNDSLFVRWDNAFYEIINLNDLSIKYGTLDTLKMTPEVLTTTRFHFQNNQLQLTDNNWVISFDKNLEQKSINHVPEHLNSTFNFKDKDGFIWMATSENGAFKLPIRYDLMSTNFEDKRISKIAVVDDIVHVGVHGEGIYKIENNESKLWWTDNSLLDAVSKIEEYQYYTFRDHLIVEKNGIFQKMTKNESFGYGKNFVPFEGKLFSEGFSGMGAFSLDFMYLKSYVDHPYYQGLFAQNDSLYSFSYKQMLFYNEAKDAFDAYKDRQIQKKLLCSNTVDNKTYIGTEGDGLYLFKEGALKKLISIDNAIVNDISAEDENSIWVVSEGKLLHYYKNESNGFTVKKYNQINGFPTSNLTEVLFHDGKLYLGSTSGLTIINGTDISETSNFTPYIKNVWVNGKKRLCDSINVIYDSDLSFKINFGSINFYDSNNTQFQYKLDPLHRDWITTESGEVNLYGLAPDNYNLLLKAQHNDMQKTLSLPISITPRWWQTYWLPVLAMITIVAIVLLILYYFMRYFRGKLLQERELAQLQLRALRSQMNPHFVFNSLAAIQYYINENNYETSEKYLVKFSKLIRQFFEMSSKEEINVFNESKLIKNYLDIEKLRFKDKMNYSLNIDSQINSETNYMPTMLLQPVVENAVNHGIFNKEDEGNITINFKYRDVNEIVVEVIDDGVGFVKSKKRKGKKKKSSMVLKDRLYFLNQSGRWEINYKTSEAFPTRIDKGNISTFIIKKL